MMVFTVRWSDTSMFQAYLTFQSCTGQIMGCFKPAYPPISPAPDTFLDAVIAGKCNFVFTVPAHVEVISDFPRECADPLRRHGRSHHETLRG